MDDGAFILRALWMLINGVLKVLLAIAEAVDFLRLLFTFTYQDKRERQMAILARLVVLVFILGAVVILFLLPAPCDGPGCR